MPVRKLATVLGVTAICSWCATAVAQVADAEAGPSDAAIQPEFVERAQGADGVDKPRWVVDFGNETRIRSLRVDPIELSGTSVNLIHWTEMRSRFDAKLKREGIGSLTLQIDALDGLLLGDNGQFVGPPPNANSGVSLSA